jgi:glycine/sarcosine N-methyltransferase
MEFYQQLAPHYDRMTNFETRLQREEQEMAGYLARHPAVTLLDAGCGTGIHALAAAAHGCTVTGVDISAAMIERAKTNAEKLNRNVHFRVGDLLNLEQVIQTKVDGILCLGNSFVHFMTEEDRNRILTSFARLLNPGGWALIQVLNYNNILRQKAGLVAEKSDGSWSVRRHYQFTGDNPEFIIDIEANGKSEKISTPIYPVMREDFEAIYRQAGFRYCDFFADIAENRFIPDQSANLCILMRV